jgi:hypothetical protein
MSLSQKSSKHPQLVLDDPVRARVVLTDFIRVAPNRGVFNPRDWDGYRNSSGRLYLFCVDSRHREETPSLVVYPKEGAREPHYQCYGCGFAGSRKQLLNFLKKDFSVEPYRRKRLRTYEQPIITTREGLPF